MVEDERCDPAEKPAEERDCVVRETSGCPVQWEVEEWGQVRSKLRGARFEDKMILQRSLPLPPSLPPSLLLNLVLH